MFRLIWVMPSRFGHIFFSWNLNKLTKDSLSLFKPAYTIAICSSVTYEEQSSIIMQLIRCSMIDKISPWLSSLLLAGNMHTKGSILGFPEGKSVLVVQLIRAPLALGAVCLAALFFFCFRRRLRLIWKMRVSEFLKMKRDDSNFC